MHEVLHIVIDAITKNIVVEAKDADALFTASIEIAGRGAHVKADMIRSLSRMHRIKTLSLLGQNAVLRDTAVRHHRNRAWMRFP